MGIAKTIIVKSTIGIATITSVLLIAAWCATLTVLLTEYAVRI